MLAFILGTFTWAVPKGPTLYEMVRIPAGNFVMGGEAGEALERPLHEVEITRDFYMGRTEITQQLFKEIMGYEPVNFWGDACKGYTHPPNDNFPVYCISWYEAIRFANALSQRDGVEQCYLIRKGKLYWPKGLDCTGYRLPTEAEWEYAAKADSQELYCGFAEPDEVAWYWDNSNKSVHQVCSPPPSANETQTASNLDSMHQVCKNDNKANGFGLYDMCGNVWEWVWDVYGDYTRTKKVDPFGPDFGDYRVRRGGSWFNGKESVRVGTRLRENPRTHFGLIGFRLVRTSPPPPLPKIKPKIRKRNDSNRID